MRKDKKTSGVERSILAYCTIVFSGLAIIVLAWASIKAEPKNTMTIFNIVLPVFASWVGTVLAFYFGRENFEAANQQVAELVHRLTPEQLAKTQITSIMRALFHMAYFQMEEGKGESDIKLSELLNKTSGKISRLPIIDADKIPKYIIHESSIDKYIAAGGKQDNTLEDFVATQKKAGFIFGLDKGFIVVSEKSSIGSAKRQMEETPFCQDIFITKHGSPNEPLTGWVSNVRMAKFLKT